MNRIITIGREFGSGGRELGRRLSEIMGIAYYDQEVIMEISRRTEMSEQYVRQIMNRRPVISYPSHQPPLQVGVCQRPPKGPLILARLKGGCRKLFYWLPLKSGSFTIFFS